LIEDDPAEVNEIEEDLSLFLEFLEFNPDKYQKEFKSEIKNVDKVEVKEQHIEADYEDLSDISHIFDFEPE
jgi:hypothetical protein